MFLTLVHGGPSRRLDCDALPTDMAPCLGTYIYPLNSTVECFCRLRTTALSTRSGTALDGELKDSPSPSAFSSPSSSPKSAWHGAASKRAVRRCPSVHQKNASRCRGRQADGKDNMLVQGRFGETRFRRHRRGLLAGVGLV